MKQRENKFVNLIDSMERAVVSISEHEFRRLKENMEALRKDFDHVSGLETEVEIDVLCGTNDLIGFSIVWAEIS